MKALIYGLLFLIVAFHHLEAQPRTQILHDYMKTQMVWKYTCTSGCPILGFNLYCDEIHNKDADFSYYGYTINVPDRAARSILVGPLVDQIMNDYRKEGETISLMEIECRVVPYNTKGEADSDIVGAPSPIKLPIYFMTNSL